ncbi:hypothetical protein [Aquabacterium sp.]|uniref:hypothetical protein n=1 Tax=Aquabacterium sp. TaxID=1872578 RepID=UPI003BB1F98C
MSQPIFAASLPEAANLSMGQNNRWKASPSLTSLLLTARNNYDWPSGTGAAKSQNIIIDLENDVAQLLKSPSPENTHTIAVKVSSWAGNNKKSHDQIVMSSPHIKSAIHTSILSLIAPSTVHQGLLGLCAVPGISLVIASKIYRFCDPQHGAAVDRHASYFTNSLYSNQGVRTTEFLREWSNSKHRASRLAIYSQSKLKQNLNEYIENYLPTLTDTATHLNSTHNFYTCSETKARKPWRPADVEMAAYYWWAQNGAR